MSKKKYRTEQEDFWAGSFGSEYIDRNQGAAVIASNLDFFSRALRQASNIKACIEFGANIGMNLKALKLLFPDVELNAVEINSDAAAYLEQFISPKNVHCYSLLDYNSPGKYDLVLIKGVLIHLNPDFLDHAYNVIYSAVGKYLLIAEYYNPTPVTITYRGHVNRLFKRDFAGEMLEKYKDLKLIDYGFVYRRDPKFPQDDISWFLLSKQC